MKEVEAAMVGEKAMVEACVSFERFSFGSCVRRCAGAGGSSLLSLRQSASSTPMPE
jgi:hypothetical protein